MISFKRAAHKVVSEAQEVIMWDHVFGSARSRDAPVDDQTALKISAFYRAVDIRSDSMGKLPISVKNMTTREEVRDHPLGPVLWLRPNEAMTPFAYKKLLEYQRLVLGRAYVWIRRDGWGTVTELIPLPPGSCTPYLDRATGRRWYIVRDPKTGEMFKLWPEDVLHYKGFSRDGLEGESILSYASRTLRTAESRDLYEQAIYDNGGHPAGVLATDTDLSNKPTIEQPDGTKLGYKDLIRREWEHIHGGPGNAFRVAVLDNGLKYQALSMSNSDAQFVENKGVTVEDIARFTGVPLNLLFTGKQSYESNEANSLDYVKNVLQPAVTGYEEEDSYKLLTLSERNRGLWLPRNMMAELRGDSESRAKWHKSMREIGLYSVNDIARLEDMPDVPGGDIRLASLNYCPLEDFQRLSEARNIPAAQGEKE